MKAQVAGNWKISKRSIDRFSSIGIGRDLTTSYVATAVTGFGLYLYHSPHMDKIYPRPTNSKGLVLTRVGYR